MYPKTQKICIFCGQVANSREHVVPAWFGRTKKVGEADRPTFTEARTVVDMNYRTGKVAVRHSFSRMTGSIYARRIKVVCTTCNNGWMSRLEQSVKFILARMAEGDRVVTTAKTRTDLAAWAVLKTIVNEYTDIKGDVPLSENISVPLSEAAHLRQYLAPSSSWSVQLYRAAKGVGDGDFKHYVVAIERKERHGQAPIIYATDGQPNTQCTTLSMGRLVIHTNSGFGPYKPLMNVYGDMMVWPLLPGMRTLPAGKDISAQDFANIGLAVYNQLIASGVRLPPIVPHDKPNASRFFAKKSD